MVKTSEERINKKINRITEKYSKRIPKLKELRYKLDVSSGAYVMNFAGADIYLNFDEEEVCRIKESNDSKVKNPNCSLKYNFASSAYRRHTSEMIVAYRIDELQKLGFRVMVDFANSFSYVPLTKSGIFDGLKCINNKNN